MTKNFRERMFILIVLLIPAFAYGEIREFLARKQSNYDNYFMDEHILFTSTGRLSRCVESCTTSTGCMSVSYNPFHTVCHGIRYGYTVDPITIGYYNMGWIYYLVLEIRCTNLHGYVYSKEFRSCYKFHQLVAALQVVDYNIECEHEGGELIRIDSEEKFNHIISFLDQFDIAEYVIIQGSHDLSEDTWRYNDGITMTYFNWAFEQPNWSTLEPKEFLALRKDDGFEMHDIWSDFTGAFICEQLIDGI